MFQECNYPELVPCDLPYPDIPEPGCVQGPTGKTCEYTELIPSPVCCDFYRDDKKICPRLRELPL